MRSHTEKAGECHDPWNVFTTIAYLARRIKLRHEAEDSKTTLTSILNQRHHHDRHHEDGAYIRGQATAWVTLWRAGLMKQTLYVALNCSTS